MKYKFYLLIHDRRQLRSVLSEAILTKLAWAMPRKLAYWCAIRVICNATQGKYSSQVVPELSAMDALKRWDEAPAKSAPPEAGNMSGLPSLA